MKVLGEDPETGLPVTLRDGRFGPFVQLGEAEKGEKPKRSSLPKGLAPAAVDLETALQLLALPREVARHPESGEPILAGIGRYGPYVQHGKTYANLGKRRRRASRSAPTAPSTSSSPRRAAAASAGAPPTPAGRSATIRRAAPRSS